MGRGFNESRALWGMIKMTPDIIELFKSVCEKMRKAEIVKAGGES